MAGIIPKNTLVLITSGVYSDYTLMTIAKAKREIDIYALRDEWIALHPEQAKTYSFSRFKFLDWICNNKKLFKELSYMEFHLTSYEDLTNDEEYTVG